MSLEHLAVEHIFLCAIYWGKKLLDPMLCLCLAVVGMAHPFPAVVLTCYPSISSMRVSCIPCPCQNLVLMNFCLVGFVVLLFGLGGWFRTLLLKSSWFSIMWIYHHLTNFLLMGFCPLPPAVQPEPGQSVGSGFVLRDLRGGGLTLKVTGVI